MTSTGVVRTAATIPAPAPQTNDWSSVLTLPFGAPGEPPLGVAQFINRVWSPDADEDSGSDSELEDRDAAADACVESQPIQDTFDLSVPERIFENSLPSRRELGERIRTVQESWETSSI